MRLGFFVVVFVLAVGSCWPTIIVLPVAAQSSSLADTQRAQASITPLDNITVAFPILSFNEASKLDGVEQSVFLDFYLSIFYQDRGLTSITSAESSQQATDARLAQITLVPEIDFVNKRSVSQLIGSVLLHQSRPSALNTVEGGAAPELFPGYPWIEISTRYAGTFKAELLLKDFPYDAQRISVQMETANSDNTTFVWNATYLLGADTTQQLKFTEWTKTSFSSVVANHFYQSTQTAYSRYTWSIDVKRIPDYYLSKIIFGIVVILVMTIFSLATRVELSDRLLEIGTLAVAVVQYLFVITSDVPKVSYTTRLDLYVEFAFYLIFAIYLESSAGHLLSHTAEDEKLAEEHEEKVRKADEEAMVHGSFSHSLRRRMLAEKEIHSSKIKEKLQQLRIEWFRPKLKAFVKYRRRIDFGFWVLSVLCFIIGTGWILLGPI